MALLNINNNKNNGKKNLENRMSKNTYNRNDKLIESVSLNNNSINASSLFPNKKLLRFSLSQHKYSNANLEDLQNIKENSDILRDKLIKTKEKYNEKNNELYNLRLKYNKLSKYNQDNLKLLYTIMNKAGISSNKEDINNNLDISQILKKEEQEILKKKHLITCFKTKLLEYRSNLDEKENEISKIKKSSRINKLLKLENDNACKNYENINLTIEKDILNRRIYNMKTIVNSLNNKCHLLRKSEDKNLNNIGELTNKIEKLSSDVKAKDKIIEDLNNKIKIGKENKQILEIKLLNLENKIKKYEEEKKQYQADLIQKDNYEKNIENMKKRLEKLQNEKLKDDLNKNNDTDKDYYQKYEELMEEKNKLSLIKDEINNKTIEKNNEIKLIDEKIKLNDEKLKEENQNINNNNENGTENLNNIYRLKEKIYLDEIDLLKQKVLKMEEKNELFNKLFI